jgi:heme/copper-type cytochrome/quinol oxidase subunit 4
MAVFKREIPTWVLSFIGIVILLAFFTALGIFETLNGVFTSWVPVVSAVSVGLGLIYMVYAQYMNYQRNKNLNNMIYLVVPLIFFAIFFGTALIVPGNISSDAYQWLYFHIYQNVGGTIYAVMFFTLASSAIRTMRVVTKDATGAYQFRLEAAALMFGGLIYTLRQIPLFQVYLPGIVGFGEWIMLVPNVGGGRAAVIAAALAAITVGIRTLWGKERTTTEVD